MDYLCLKISWHFFVQKQFKNSTLSQYWSQIYTSHVQLLEKKSNALLKTSALHQTLFTMPS